MGRMGWMAKGEFHISHLEQALGRIHAEENSRKGRQGRKVKARKGRFINRSFAHRLVTFFRASISSAFASLAAFA